MQAVVVETEMVGLKVRAGTLVKVVPVPPAQGLRVTPQVAPVPVVVVPMAPTPVRAVPSPELAPVRVRVGGSITIVEGGGSAVDEVFIADGPISGQSWVVSLSPGTVVPASRLSPSHAGRVVGVTLGAAADGDQVTVRSSGPLHEVSWSWTPDVDLVLGTNGLATQAIPTTGFLQVVGWATGPDDIYIDLGNDPVILSS